MRAQLTCVTFCRGSSSSSLMPGMALALGSPAALALGVTATALGGVTGAAAPDLGFEVSSVLISVLALAFGGSTGDREDGDDGDL